jgi:hypothetical protein
VHAARRGPLLPTRERGRAGNFGFGLQNNKGNNTDGILNSETWVAADLSCDGMKLYYRQCILSSTLATIIGTIGAIIFIAISSACCICFGLCKCGHPTNELHCCYVVTCRSITCCAPAPETSTILEDVRIAKSLTGKVDEEQPADGEGSPVGKKLTAKEKLAQRRAMLGSKSTVELVENPMKG